MALQVKSPILQESCITPMHMPRSESVFFNNNRFRAFTLVELLTVIAIIGVLAAILFPVLGMVRDRAKLATCTSNLRTIGQALHMFAGEHKGYLPASRETLGLKPNGDAIMGDYWYVKLKPYMDWGDGGGKNSAGVCPAADYKSGSNYALNSKIAGGEHGVYLTTITLPAKAMMVTEAWATGEARIYFAEYENGRNYGMSYPHGTRNVQSRLGVQGERANVLFVDGRVQAMTPEQIPADPKLRSKVIWESFWRGQWTAGSGS